MGTVKRRSAACKLRIPAALNTMVLRVHGAQKVQFRSKRYVNLTSSSTQEGSHLLILNLLIKGYTLCETMDLITLVMEISREKLSLDMNMIENVRLLLIHLS